MSDDKNPISDDSVDQRKGRGRLDPNAPVTKRAESRHCKVLGGDTFEVSDGNRKFSSSVMEEKCVTAKSSLTLPRGEMNRWIAQTKNLNGEFNAGAAPIDKTPSLVNSKVYKLLNEIPADGFPVYHDNMKDYQDFRARVNAKFPSLGQIMDRYTTDGKFKKPDMIEALKQYSESYVGVAFPSEKQKAQARYILDLSHVNFSQEDTLKLARAEKVMSDAGAGVAYAPSAYGATIPKGSGLN